MPFKHYFTNFFLIGFLIIPSVTFGQKPLTEGVVEYKVHLKAIDGQEYDGRMQLSVKSGRIRKDLRLNNGFEFLLIVDCNLRKAYSLKNAGDKLYAVQLEMRDLEQKQDPFRNFTMIIGDQQEQLAGLTTNTAFVSYPDSNQAQILISRDWYPEKGLTFEWFPDAHFFPLKFSFRSENGSVLTLTAERFASTPMEEALFRIPKECKMINNNEFRQLNK